MDGEISDLFSVHDQIKLADVVLPLQNPLNSTHFPHVLKAQKVIFVLTRPKGVLVY